MTDTKIAIIKWSFRIIYAVFVTWAFYEVASCFAPAARQHQIETCGE